MADRPNDAMGVLLEGLGSSDIAAERSCVEVLLLFTGLVCAFFANMDAKTDPAPMVRDESVVCVDMVS